MKGYPMMQKLFETALGIQAAKRKARGYKFKHFKSIVYLMTGKIDFSKVNKFCQPT